MILRFVIAFAIMGGAAFAVSRSAPFLTPILSWLVIAAAICALSAGAIASQPIGQPTAIGYVGGLFVRWGFVAGHGRLLPGVVISWMVWALFGSAVIIAAQHRADREFQFMVFAWMADTWGLMYIVGLMLARTSGGTARALLPVAGILVAMIVVSAFQWFRTSSPGGRQSALLIGAGPPLFIAAGYALFLLFALTIGRNARWN